MSESRLLRKARDYEEENALKVPESERPLYHVTGPVGWINDPNGFSEYGGYHHLFFQYHPYSAKWGPMHWGHVRSRDFITWEYLPAALAPDEEYDNGGCFSGSAISLPDGKHLLMYTSVRKPDEAGAPEYQQQSIAVGDGIDYVKSPVNPVIDSTMVPYGCSTSDFRDPKIFMENGRYYAVICNRTADGSGSVLLYESTDCLSWKYLTVVDRSDNKFGKMWECPDYFPLGDKQVLMVSPENMTGEEGFYAGSISVFIIGNKRADLSLERESISLIDYGPDFYAPQTMHASDGRRIMIGWMQNWSTADGVSFGRMIFGQMTIPRELEMRNGRVFQTPVRELDNYRSGKIIRSGCICGKTCFEDIRGRAVDLSVTIDTDNEAFDLFGIEVAKSSDHTTMISYERKCGRVIIDRSKSGCCADPLNIREFEVTPKDGRFKVRLLLDKNSVELFFNDGEVAASMCIYTPQEADGICFYADKPVRAEIEKYTLELRSPAAMTLAVETGNPPLRGTSLSPSTVNLDDLAGEVVG